MKQRQRFSSVQRREYAKLMVDEGYSNQEVEEISGASSSAVSRWKARYLGELSGITSQTSAITPEHKRIQELEKQLKRAQREVMPPKNSVI